MPLTDRRTVRRLVRELGLRPRRAAGQHFLVDGRVAAASVRAAGLTRRDTVLEIGAGLGALTERLAAAAGRVIAVERDRSLAAHLRQAFAGCEGVVVVEGDVFQLRLDEYVADGRYRIVANLPYNVSSLVFRNFLVLPPRPRSMTVLVQREVADRLVGAGGDRSLLTLLAGLTATTRVVRQVDRDAFWPVPAVQSSLVHLALAPALPSDFTRTMRLARVAFAGRRKQLKNSLLAGLRLGEAEVAARLRRAGVEPSARPQELSVKQWQSLCAAFVDTGSNP